MEHSVIRETCFRQGPGLQHDGLHPGYATTGNKAAITSTASPIPVGSGTVDGTGIDSSRSSESRKSPL
jgi:hypothetical protein